jgi:hypothetical protein
MSIFVLFITIPFVLFAQFGSSYDIEEIYGEQNVSNGTLAITRFGGMEEIEKILIPIRLDTGRYKVSVRKVDTNIYEIIGKDIYVKTRSCYEGAYNEEVILEITSPYGWNKGKIYFE